MRDEVGVTVAEFGVSEARDPSGFTGRRDAHGVSDLFFRKESHPGPPSPGSGRSVLPFFLR